MNRFGKFLALFSLFILSMSILFAHPSAKRNPPFLYVRTNLLEPFTVTGEFPLADKLRVNMGFSHRPASLNYIENIKVNNFLLEYRYYTSPFYIEKNSQRSYFAAPYTLYSVRNDEYERILLENGKLKHPSKSINDKRLILGGIVGYQWNFTNRLSIDAFVGGGLSLWRRKTITSFDNKQAISKSTTYDFRLGLAIGFWLD